MTTTTGRPVFTTARAGGAATERERAALREFLQAQRRCADPTRFPLVGNPTRNSPLRGISQAQLAEALGMTEGYYRQIEGGSRRLEPRYLDVLADLLELTATDRAVLYRLTLGGEPDPPPVPLTVGPAIRAVIDNLPFPAYITGVTWEILYTNSHLPALLPNLTAGANLMLETATNPELRRMLADYRNSWLRPALGQLRERLSRATGNTATDLQRLAETVLRRSPAARMAWSAFPDTVYQHPDTGLRPILRAGAVEYLQLGAASFEDNPMHDMHWAIPLGPHPTDHPVARERQARRKPAAIR